LLVASIACGPSARNADSNLDSDGPGLGALMPQIVKDGSDVITSPTVMVIDYTMDGSASQVEQAASQLAASSAWGTMTSEYGVSNLTAASPQEIPGALPATLSDSTLQAMLGSNLGAGEPWGAASASTVYTFLIPGAVAYDNGSGAGAPCCGSADAPSYFGYHASSTVGGVDVPYAVVCECADPPSGETSLQLTTATLSHELVDAATAPRTDGSGDSTGYSGVLGAFVAWQFATGAGPADLCEDADTQLWTDAPGMTFALQRSWSNAAAMQGHDPCVGDPTVPYYQTVPSAPDFDVITATLHGAAPVSLHTHVNLIEVGSAGTVTMQVYADQSNAGPFTVNVEDISGEDPPALAITPPTGTYHAGDTVTFGVQVNSGGDASTFSATAEPYVVTTTPASGSGAGPTTYFYSLIAQ
jgi:hypothetical protein